MRPVWYIVATVVATLVAYQSWYRFEYLIGLDPGREEHYQLAYTNFWMLCIAVAWVTVARGVMGYSRGRRGDYHVAEFFFGLALTNLLDELFFNPMEIAWAEYIGMAVAAYISVTGYFGISPVENSLTWIAKQAKKVWHHRSSRG